MHCTFSYTGHIKCGLKSAVKDNGNHTYTLHTHTHTQYFDVIKKYRLLYFNTVTSWFVPKTTPKSCNTSIQWSEYAFSLCMCILPCNFIHKLSADIFMYVRFYNRIHYGWTTRRGPIWIHIWNIQGKIPLNMNHIV